MSSTATVGRIRVDGTRPEAPLHNLLSAPGVLVSGGRWDGGINLWGYSDGLPALWDACSSGTFNVKEDAAGDVPVEGFDSFVIYLALDCSTFGIATDLAGFARRADLVLEATQSFAVEQALSQGIPGLNNKYLGDAGLTSLATNVSPAVGLSYLENAIGATGRAGVIHLTPAVAAQLNFQINATEVGALTTSTGNDIVIGGGYIGTDPDNEISPSPDHDWIFATGPIQARLSEILVGPEEVQGMVDHETNEVIYRAEKLANVAWDGVLQVGVLVDWTP